MSNENEKGFLIRGPLGMAVWRYEREGEDLLVVEDDTNKQLSLQVVRMNPQGARYASTLLTGTQQAVDEATEFILSHVINRATGWIDIEKREAG